MKLIQALFHNIPYKLISLAFALMLWYMVQGEEIVEVSQKIKVHFIAPKGYIIKGPQFYLRDASFRGTRVALGDRFNRPIESTYKLKTNQKGTARIRVDQSFIKNWNNKLSLRVYDPYINLYLDEEVTQYVRLKENLQGIPKEGFILEKTTLEPETIKIRGPASEIHKIQTISTEAINIDGLDKSSNFTVQAYPQANWFEVIGDEKIQVSIRIGEQKINRTFKHIPIEIEGDHDHISYSPKTVTIVIQGTPKVFSYIKRKDLWAFLDTHKLAPGRYEKKIQVKIPPDTILIETIPENAILNVIK